MRNKKILLADDEESIRRSLALDFAHSGYMVQTAADGHEAIGMLAADRFDLLVTDLVMPVVDGIGVLKEAKQRIPDIGAIILTGFGHITTAIEALRLGADD